MEEQQDTHDEGSFKAESITYLVPVFLVIKFPNADKGKLNILDTLGEWCNDT